MTPPRLHNLLAFRSIIYAVINIFPSGVALVVMPFITHKISPAEYGISGLYLSIISALLVSMEYSLILRKAYVKHDAGEQEQYLSESITACIGIYTLAILVFTVVTMVGWDWFASFIPLTRGWMLAALFTGGMQAFVTLTFALLQIAQRVKHYCVLKLLFTFSYTFGALIFLFVFDMGWEGIAYASVMGSVLTMLIAAWRVRSIFHLRLRVKKAALKSTLRSVLSLTPFRVALAIFTYGGPFLVAYVTDTEQSGLYIFAYQICNVIALVYDSILTAIVPYMVAHHASPMAVDRRTRRYMVATYVLLVCCASLGMALIAPYLVGFLFPVAYAAALPYVGWVALARVFHGVNRVNQELSMFDTDSFRRIALVSFCIALAYVVLTLMLLKIYGGVGAAMGLAVGHGIWMLVLFFGRPWLIRHKA